MRRRHRDQGWTYQRPGRVTPAHLQIPALVPGAPAWIPSPDGKGFVPAPVPEPVKPPLTLRRAALKAGHRHRRQLAPWLALPVVPAVALGADLGHAQIVVTLASAATAAVILRRCWPAARTARWYAAAYKLGCPVAIAGWVTWASWCGLTASHALAVWVALWAASALPWWNRHRVRHQHGKPAEQLAGLTPDELLHRLRTRVCGSGQRLAGAVVSAAAPMEGGRAFLFTGVPGKQTTEHILAAAGEIASAAEAPRSRVIVEPAPGELPGEHGPAHLAKVTILDAQNVHRQIQEYEGLSFDPATGLFDVGPYPDSEMAPARLCKVDERGRPMRAASGIVFGAPGAGKSRYVTRKVTEHRMCGLFKVFLLDGQGGASVPELLDHVDWAATRPDEWERCLRALVRLMIARTRAIAARRQNCWYATPADPFVQCVIEEAHKPLKSPLNLRMVKHLLQEGEKAGIGVDLVTQFPSQMELGGASGTVGANVLRSMATAGNVVLFRTGDESSKNMTVGAVEVNPRLLPQVPGMCYVLGASMRIAPVRAIRVPDEDASSWLASAPETSFGEMDVAALGEDYATRWGRFAAADAEQSAATLDMDSLEAELRLITGEEDPEAEGGKDAAVQARTVIQACWDIIKRKGSAKRADLIAEIGCSASAVDQALKALARTEKVRQGSGGGVWEAVGLHAVPSGGEPGA